MKKNPLPQEPLSSSIYKQVQSDLWKTPISRDAPYEAIQQQVRDPILFLRIENMLNRQVNAQIPSIDLQEHIESRVRYSLEDIMEHVAETIITELNSPGMPIGFRPGSDT